MLCEQLLGAQGSDTTVAADSTSMTEEPVKKKRKLLSKRPAKWIKGKAATTLRRPVHDLDINSMFDKTTMRDKVVDGKLCQGKERMTVRTKPKKKIADIDPRVLAGDRYSRPPSSSDEESSGVAAGFCLKTLFENHLVKEERGSIRDAEEERTDLPLGVLEGAGGAGPCCFNEEDDA